MPIQLPAITTDDGVLARVLIAENLTPFDPRYDEAVILSGMQAQRAVLQNRLAHLDRDPVHFGAPGATDLTDIVLGTNPQAIAGFSRGPAGEVVIVQHIRDNIDLVLKQANTGAPGKFFRFVDHAITTAKTAAADPFAGLANINGVLVFGGAYFWRTEGRGGPGGTTVPIPDALGGLIAGNRFFALKR